MLMLALWRVEECATNSTQIAMCSDRNRSSSSFWKVNLRETVREVVAHCHKSVQCWPQHHFFLFQKYEKPLPIFPSLQTSRGVEVLTTLTVLVRFFRVMKPLSLFTLYHTSRGMEGLTLDNSMRGTI